jgi:hypothetical protein
MTTANIANRVSRVHFVVSLTSVEPFYLTNWQPFGPQTMLPLPYETG